jgi:hypothetical protein
MPRTTTTDKPQGMPSGNDLDKIRLEVKRREVRLGAKVLLALDDPPHLGETIDVTLRLRCTKIGEMLIADDDVVGFCAMKVVTAWEAGQTGPPTQDAMIDHDGQIIEGDDEDEDEGPIV